MPVDSTGEFKEMLRTVLKEELAPVHVRLDRLEQDMQEVKVTLQRHDELIHQLIQIVAATNAKVDTLDKKVQAMAEEHTFIKQAVLETSETVKRMENKLENHDRTLDILARRSIEHEAALKRIGR